MTSEHNDHQAEAERLKLLPIEQQREVIELHRSVANDANVTQENRKLARARVKALTKALGLNPKPKK